jgi:hypothetical protein
LSLTSSSPLPRLEGLAATFGRYFNLYVIYIDYFHYMRSLSHEHQPRGAGGVLKDQFILDNEVLSGALMRKDLKTLWQPSVTTTPTAPALGADATMRVHWRTNSS